MRLTQAGWSLWFDLIRRLGQGWDHCNSLPAKKEENKNIVRLMSMRLDKERGLSVSVLDTL